MFVVIITFYNMNKVLSFYIKVIVAEYLIIVHINSVFILYCSNIKYPMYFDKDMFVMSSMYWVKYRTAGVNRYCHLWHKF